MIQLHFMIGYYRFKTTGDNKVVDELVRKLNERNKKLVEERGNVEGLTNNFCFFIPKNSNDYIYYACIDEPVGDTGWVDPVLTEEFVDKGVYPERIDKQDFINAASSLKGIEGTPKGSYKFYLERIKETSL